MEHDVVLSDAVYGSLDRRALAECPLSRSESSERFIVLLRKCVNNRGDLASKPTNDLALPVPYISESLRGCRGSVPCTLLSSDGINWPAQLLPDIFPVMDYMTKS